MTRRDWWIVLGITLLAGALRFYQLGVVPPGPQFDEAFNAIDASQVIAGNRPLFLPATNGLLANDGPLRLTVVDIVTQPDLGSVTFQPDGDLMYAPPCLL